MPRTRPFPSRFSLLPLLLGALLLSLSSCKGKGIASRGKPERASMASAFVSSPAEAAATWVPDQRDGSRFRVDGEPKIYDKETIFELLNGGADSLLEVGLLGLLHVRLRDDAAVFTDCEIQVMDVSSPPQAKTLLAKEKAPEAKQVKLGDDGFAEPTGVLFAKGRHLVRVTALPSGSRKTAPIMEIAGRVAATSGASW